MYAIVADFVLKPSKYMHEPGSLRAVSFEHHHLVTWRAFHPSKWSAHYYGQVNVESRMVETPSKACITVALHLAAPMQMHTCSSQAGRCMCMHSMYLRLANIGA